MRPRATPREAMIPVPLPKGCLLLLTPEEFERGIRRGKWYRGAVAMQAQLAQTEQRGTACA